MKYLSNVSFPLIAEMHDLGFNDNNLKIFGLCYAAAACNLEGVRAAQAFNAGILASELSFAIMTYREDLAGLKISPLCVERFKALASMHAIHLLEISHEAFRVYFAKIEGLLPRIFVSTDKIINESRQYLAPEPQSDEEVLLLDHGFRKFSTETKHTPHWVNPKKD
jgi:hypothetical protein